MNLRPTLMAQAVPPMVITITAIAEQHHLTQIMPQLVVVQDTGKPVLLLKLVHMLIQSLSHQQAAINPMKTDSHTRLLRNGFGLPRRF